MSSVYIISKATTLEVPPVKQNNFINKGLSIILQFKYVICVQTLLGINRIYLLIQNKILLWLNYTYIVLSTFISLFLLLGVQTTGVSSHVIQHTICYDFLLLVLNALFAKKQKFKHLFQKLSSFDDILNIGKDLKVLNAARTATYWIVGSFIYNLLECIMVLMSYPDPNFVLICYYTMSLAHDTEQIFYFTLLKTICLRAEILKTHVYKAFPVIDDTNAIKKLNKVEALSENAQLEIASLYMAFKLLHKCSEQLNSIMSFPMLVTLFSSGISVTMLLKIAVTTLQNLDHIKAEVAISSTIYVLIRCAKYALYVTAPCYYSSVTASHVSTMRTTLHDAVNTMGIDKTERRKIKAFFLLTKENEFAYALYGVIRFNMTLPLSFTSLCTTYLVIIIQFSKFID